MAIRLFTLIFMLLHTLCVAQYKGIGIVNNRQVTTVSFQKHSDLIIVPVWFNKGEVLNFILDTGSRYTILNEARYVPPSKILMDKQVKLLGADMRLEMMAYLVSGISMQLSNIQMERQNILVLKEDYLRLENLLGMPVHGILGADLFERFIVKIDYRNSLLTFFERAAFRLPRGFGGYEATIDGGKPYLEVPLQIDNDTVSSRLMIDTGASVSVLLHPNVSKNIRLPKNVVSGGLAHGLGGEVEGMLGRIERLDLSPFVFNNMVINFQDLSQGVDSVYVDDRDGIIGGGLLSRFTLITDYAAGKVYLKSASKYNRAFNYDRSGLKILAGGKYLKQFIVMRVIDKSPAQRADIQPGDRILRINGRSHKTLNLEVLTKMLQRKAGRKIRLTLEREGKKIKRIFWLEDLI